MIMGILMLGIMTYEDFKNVMQVDDRRNWLMLGCTIMLLAFIKRSFWYILIVAIGTIVMTIILNRFHAFGAADNSALSWIMAGFAYVSPIHSLAFMLIFGALLTIQLTIKKLLKVTHPTPLFMAIFLSFILNCFLWRYLWL